MSSSLTKQIQAILDNQGLLATAQGQQALKNLIDQTLNNGISNDTLTGSTINLNVLTPQITTSDLQSQQQAQAQKQKQSLCCPEKKKKKVVKPVKKYKKVKKCKKVCKFKKVPYYVYPKHDSCSSSSSSSSSCEC